MWCGRDKCTSQPVWDQNSEFCPKCANPVKMLISVVSVFLSLWACSTESPEHILDGTGYTSPWLLPSDSAWWREKEHIAQAGTKLPLRGLLFLYFSSLFNQEESSEREGKATPLSSVKALCMQRAALQVSITSLGTESLCARVFPRQPEGPWRGRGELWGHFAGTAAGAGGVGTGQELHLASLVCPAVTFTDFLKPSCKCSVDNTQRGGGKGNKTPSEKSYPDRLGEWDKPENCYHPSDYSGREIYIPLFNMRAKWRESRVKPGDRTWHLKEVISA